MVGDPAVGLELPRMSKRADKRHSTQRHRERIYVWIQRVQTTSWVETEGEVRV